MKQKHMILCSLLAAVYSLAASPALAQSEWSEGIRSGTILPLATDSDTSDENLSPVTKEISSVVMEEEELSIDLWTSGAEIRATYRLRNVTDRPAYVRFGFPVEAVDGKAVKEYSISSRGVRFDGFQEGYRKVMRSIEPAKHSENEQETEAFVPEMSRGWMVSELNFAPKEEVKVRIRCSVPYLVEYTGDTAMNRKLVYRLSPASFWHGPIGKGKVTVRARSVDAGDVTIFPAHRFVRRNHVWEWAFENLEPTAADDIEITLDPENDMNDSCRRDEIARGADGAAVRFVPIEGMAVAATSQAKGTVPEVDIPGLAFAPENMLDNPKREGRWYHVWGVPGKGRGESATVTLPQPEKLAGFFICPGFGTPTIAGGLESLFPEYGSVTEMEVIVNGTWKRQVRFELGYDGSRWVSMEDCPLKAETVQFIIKDSIPGRMYDITCLSDLRFYRELPKADPARQER